MGFVMPRHSFGFSLPDWLLDVLSKEEVGAMFSARSLTLNDLRL